MGFFDTLFQKLGQKKEPVQPVSTAPTSFLSTVQKNLPYKPVGQITAPKPVAKVDSNALVKTAAGLPAELGRAVITRPIRTVVKSFEELGGYLGDKQYKPQDFVPTTPVEKALYGTQPIKSYPEQSKEMGKQAKEIQAPITGPDGQTFFRGVNKNIAYPLAFLGTIGIPLGDLMPGGGEKKKAAELLFKGTLDEIFEAGIKTTDDIASANLLKKAGVDEIIATEKAPLLTAAKTKKEVEAIVRDSAAKQVQKVQADTIRRVDELSNAQKGIAIAEDGKKIRVEPRPLTADELEEYTFLNKNKNKPENIIMANRVAESEGGLFHGSQSGKLSMDENGNINFGTAKDDITQFAGDSGKVIDVPMKDLNIKDFATKEEMFDAVTKNKQKYLDEGVDVVRSDNHAIAINPEKVAQVSGVEVSKPFLDRKISDVIDTSSKNIKTVQEDRALEIARSGLKKERKYITSAKASEDIASDVSREISETYTPKSNKELVDRSAQRVADDFEEAKKFANENSTDEAVATRVAIDKQLSAEYAEASTKAEKDAIAQELTDSLIQHARLATEEGRTVQANALLGKTTPEGMLRTTSKMIDRYNKTARNKIAQITKSDVQFVLEEGKKIEGMAEGLAKETAKKRLADKLQSLIPSSMWQKIVHVWKAGLLTGIKTTGVNISSNFFNGLSENIKNIPATGIDLATSIFTGKRTKALTLRGLGQGTAEGVKKGWNYLKTGVDEGVIEKSGLEFNQVHFDSKPGKALQAYADGVYRILGTEDMPFFYGALRRSLGEQAIVSIKNGKKTFTNSAERSKYIQDFIDNPSKEALELADLDAKVATFRNDTALGRAATSVRNSTPVAEVILPFAKTPSAVATAMFNYTPAGAVMAVYRNIIKGPFNQKDFAEALGRSVTGFGALWLGKELYKKGKITLGYPKDEKERNEWEATGKTANSILIGGKWIPLVTFGPQGSVLGIGGNFQKGLDETGSISGGVTSGLFGGVKGLTEQTFLTGVKNLTDAINDPERFGPSYASRLAGSIIPTILSDFSQAFDDYQRKSTGNVIDAVKARIPGARETLPKKLDVWGQPLERNRTIVGTAISPIRLSNPIEGPLNTEIERLKELGEDIRPTKVNTSIKSIKLEDDEYYKYQRLYGKIASKGLTALINNPDYQKQDPEQQAKLFSDAISDIKKATGEALLPELLRARYELPADQNMEMFTEVANQLYKKSPEFARASTEKQKKVILKLMGTQ